MGFAGSIWPAIMEGQHIFRKSVAKKLTNQTIKWHMLLRAIRPAAGKIGAVIERNFAAAHRFVNGFFHHTDLRLSVQDVYR